MIKDLIKMALVLMLPFSVNASTLENLYSGGHFQAAITKFEEDLPTYQDIKLLDKHLGIIEFILFQNDDQTLNQLRNIYNKVKLIDSESSIIRVGVLASALDEYISLTKLQKYKAGLKYYDFGRKKSDIIISIEAKAYFMASYLFLNDSCAAIDRKLMENCHYHLLFAKGNFSPYSNFDEITQYLKKFKKSSNYDEVMEELEIIAREMKMNPKRLKEVKKWVNQ